MFFTFSTYFSPLPTSDLVPTKPTIKNCTLFFDYLSISNVIKRNVLYDSISISIKIIKSESRLSIYKSTPTPLPFASLHSSLVNILHQTTCSAQVPPRSSSAPPSLPSQKACKPPNVSPYYPHVPADSRKASTTFPNCQNASRKHA